MRRYENMLLLDGALEPKEVGELTDKIIGTIERFGGKVLKTQNWGKRRCAYRVKKQTHANYVLLWFDGSPNIIDELRRQYRLIEPILKYIFVRPSKAMVIVPTETGEEQGAGTAGQPSAATTEPATAAEGSVASPETASPGAQELTSSRVSEEPTVSDGGSASWDDQDPEDEAKSPE